MTLFLAIAVGAGLLAMVWFLVKKRRNDRLLAAHSISPAELHELISSGHELILYDARLSLELLAYAEIIPGSIRLNPATVDQVQASLPRDKDIVAYCTCVADKTSRMIVGRALEQNFTRIKLLKGGLAGWKDAGFPVERYTQSFHLDTWREAS
jgi:rhodanese-related sulfurtransferase